MSTRDMWNQLGEQNVAIGQIGIVLQGGQYRCIRVPLQEMFEDGLLIDDNNVRKF